METLKTIAIDIAHTVFDNDTEAILYVTKDIYSDSFIVSIPILTFSYEIWEDNKEMGYSDLLNTDVIASDRRERLVKAIRKGIAEFN